jgi:prolyl-tRNA editing enzyme YbaK/EbsC (Cys-tRNA(Pro) deacylase)
VPDESTVYNNIIALLDTNGVDYRRVEHGPTRTSEESAAARGEPIHVGGKALVMKVGDGFALFVISAALKADAGAIRARFGTKKSRFATPDELMELTGLVPGSVPPFGRPILDLDLYADESIAANDRIAFNAGSLTQSIVMPIADYMRIVEPVVFRFGQSL